MSWKHLNAAWKVDCDTSAKKFVLVALADASNDSGKSWQSEETIGQRCSLVPRSVRRQIRSLEKAGLVSVEHRQGRTSLVSLSALATPDSLSGVKVVNTPDNGDTNPGQRRHQPRTACPPTPDSLSSNPGLSKDPSYPAVDDGLLELDADGTLTQPKGVSVQQFRKPRNASEESLWPNGVPIHPVVAQAVQSIGTKRAANGPCLEDVMAFASARGIPNAKANRFFDLNERNGWRFPNNKPIEDWKSAIHNFAHPKPRL